MTGVGPIGRLGGWLSARALELLSHEFRHLPLKLFRRRRPVENWSVHKTHITLLASIAHIRNKTKHDAEGRVLEDALCLVFLEHQFGALASKTADDKMINALQKAWRKMSPAAQALDLKLSHGPHAQALLEKALKPAERNPQTRGTSLTWN